VDRDHDEDGSHGGAESAGSSLRSHPFDEEIAEEPTLRETGTVVEVDHPKRGKYLTVGNPIKLSDSPPDVRRSPLLGEHTEEILRTVLGLSEGDIQAAREQKAI